eukprot:1157888-Pelagomonas_calceolata.AAC.10
MERHLPVGKCVPIICQRERYLPVKKTPARHLPTRLSICQYWAREDTSSEEETWAHLTRETF